MIKVAAFFDVDETLIHTKSMFDFYQFWCEKFGREDAYRRYSSKLEKNRASGVAREQLNREYYQQYEGQNYHDLERVALEWFQSRSSPSFFIEHAVAALKEHQRLGHVVVFVSGSMLPILRPIAQFLNVKHILCTSLIVDQDGLVSGRIGTPQTIGEGKRNAMYTFCRQHGIELTKSSAYGDDISDLPMLKAVSDPVCVGDNPQLIQYAITHGWKVLGETL